MTMNWLDDCLDIALSVLGGEEDYRDDYNRELLGDYMGQPARNSFWGRGKYPLPSF